MSGGEQESKAATLTVSIDPPALTSATAAIRDRSEYSFKGSGESNILFRVQGSILESRDRTTQANLREESRLGERVTGDFLVVYLMLRDDNII